MKRYHICIILSLSFFAQKLPAKERVKSAACLEYAAMKVGEFGKDLSASALYILAEIAEKGINIRKFHFSGSIEAIEKGVLPYVEIEGVIVGKEFHIVIDVTEEDLKDAKGLITKVAEAISKKEEEVEETPEKALIVSPTKEVKE